MRQLQLFTSSELAAMRDRTRSRRYSPAGEEFRREHARQRAWGLARRHAEKLRRLRAAAPADDRPAGSAPEPVPSPPPPAIAAEQAEPLATDASSGESGPDEGDVEPQQAQGSDRPVRAAPRRPAVRGNARPAKIGRCSPKMARATSSGHYSNGPPASIHHAFR
ncbi:MAG TPA: hypothetical protein VL738_18845 [Dactylosporangium sp.]|nr:hypothetical protein [Dactylosporangium sp.]